MSVRAQGWTATFLWRWEDAPERLKVLIPPARRGLWVACVPKPYADEKFRWQAALGPMVSRHPLTDGDVCLIGAEVITDG